MKRILTLSLFCLGTVSVYAAHYCANPICGEHRTEHRTQQSAQEREEFKQKISALRAAYFTEGLQLTPAEAEKFWPLYNTYLNEREQLMSEFVQKTRKKRENREESKFDVSKLSDTEVAKLLDNKARQIDIEKKFHNDLCKLFSPQRALMFYYVEREFQRYLINYHRGSKENANGQSIRKKQDKE